MSDHAPAPWHVYERNIGEFSGGIEKRIGSAESGKIIATVHGIVMPDYDANARLIAAAPDLLAACEEINGWDMSSLPQMPDWYPALRAAIQKARGEAE